MQARGSRRSDRRRASAPFSSTASMRSPSPSNATPRSNAPLTTSSCSAARSVAPQPTLMLEPFGSLPIASTSAPSCSNAPRREAGVRAVRAVDRDAQAGQVRAEALEHVLRDSCRRRCRRGRSRRRRGAGASSSASISSSAASVSLRPVAVEELDAVVLGRVVRRRDDDAEIEPEQRDGRSRHDACEHGGAAGRDDAARECLFELLARAARVAADEHATAARPERRRLAELLDEIGGEELAHDAR